ncbi:MAG: permease-like cell division protein FtsX, partial [Patescibacteria group bacterium]|nr:permease-like cell division protein FtsX [Patescibacteria group bacterium]
MLISLKRIFRSGFLDFWRNSVVSFSSVFVLTVTLFVIGCLLFLQATLESTLQELRDKVDVNVYFIPIAGEADILGVKTQIEALPEVERVEYVTREQALENFRIRHADDQLTLQALDELGDNPLGAVLNVKAREPSQYESVARFLESSPALSKGESSIVDNVNYFQNKIAIERLAGFIDVSERVGLLATIALAAISVLITFNTIRLAIYTSRDEIAVMKLVGASSAYVRGPFIIEGVLAGVVAGVLALGLFYPLTYWLGPITEQFFASINLFIYYRAHFAEIFLIVMGSGIALGALSSFLAT